jgi:hypothetical protein
MIQIILTFLSAFLLSGIAAYYSVVGLTSIFVGAYWSVVIMGSSLEFAKLVTASWLYRNWKTAPWTLKSYLTVSVLLLMLITSMGIFGFLSKSHIDSTLDAGSNTVELKTLTQQETILKDKLDYLLKRAKDPSTASNKLDKQIQTTQKQLSEVNDKKMPLLKESNKLAADIGPIKYVADMFYGEDENGVDKAVRMVIMLIMLVFDPLAVLLLIAGNISLEKRNGNVLYKTSADDANSNTRISHSTQVEERPVATNEVDEVQLSNEETDEKIEERTVEISKENIAEGPTIEHEEVHHVEGLYSTTQKG